MTQSSTLEAFRLADSFLPIGTYSISYGLEQFVNEDRITEADDLQPLLETYLRHQLGPADLVALRAAHEAACDADLDRICAVDRRLTAVTLAAELRTSAQQSGERLLSLQRDLRDEPLLDRFDDQIASGSADGNHAVVLGVTTALAGIEQRTACLLCCHGFVTGLLGAAQRLLSVGHTDAQQILADLQETIADVVADSADRSTDDMTPFAPSIDIASADHERADRRLFAS